MANRNCRSCDRSAASRAVVGAVASAAVYRRHRRERRKARRCFRCCATTPVGSGCLSFSPTPAARRWVRRGPRFVGALSFQLITFKRSFVVHSFHFRTRLTLNYHSLGAPRTTESCDLSCGTGCRSLFFLARSRQPTSFGSPSSSLSSLFWSAPLSCPFQDR